MDKLAKEILKDFALDEITAPPAQKRSPVDHWSSAVLLERAAYLRKMAKFGNGSASEVIREYPQHKVTLLFQGRSSEAELHQNFTYFIHVLAGAATLVTGGTLVGAKVIAPGEKRGESIEGGYLQELRAGDVAHVPAGIAHQFLIAGDKPITCLMVRIQETL
jgi:uncharacterized RmlC-like cupin family protein